MFRKVKREFAKAKRHSVQNTLAFVLEYLQLVPEMESLVAPARAFSFFGECGSLPVLDKSVLETASSFRVSIP